MHDPLEDHSSSSPSCVQNGSLFLTIMKPKELLEVCRQPESIDCQNFVQSYIMSPKNKTEAKLEGSIVRTSNPYIHM